MSHEESPETTTTGQKLVLFKSPLIGRSDSGSSDNGLPVKQPTAPDMSLFGNRYDDDCPQFQKVWGRGSESCIYMLTIL